LPDKIQNGTMKKTVALFIFVVVGIKCYSQFATPPTNVESLKLNSAPAYVILNVEPENIQRPTSPQQFVAGVQNAIVNGKLKPNVAMEITPFYMAKPENDKSSRFNVYSHILNEDNSPGSNIKKTFSISFATSESDTVAFGKLKPGMGLGFGIRTVLINTKSKNEVVDNLKKWMESEVIRVFFGKLQRSKWADSQKGMIDSLISYSNSFKQLALTNQSFNGLPYSYASKIIDSINTVITSNIINNAFVATDASIQSFQAQFAGEVNRQTLLQSVYLSKINGKNLPLTSSGFSLELGAGYASVLEKNEFNGWKYAKAGVWLTPSWRWTTSKDDKVISLFDFMGVVRYTLNNKKDSIDQADYLDAGLKTQFTRNKWSGSLEFVNRWASSVPDTVNSKTTYRLAVGIDYKITDALTFKFTFGSNFDGNTRTYSKPKEMFAIGGLNLGIFNPFKKDN
jgi:hypothetical protein